MKSNQMKKQWMRWLVAGTLGVGFVGAMPVGLMAQEDGDGARKVDENKVPAAVVATARTYTLDATNIAYRLGEGKDKDYRVNFVTPEKVRLQVVINEAGQVIGGVREAPNQPDGAPKGAERERIAAAWIQRIEQNRAAQAAAAARAQTPPLAEPGRRTPLSEPGSRTPMAEQPAADLPPAGGGTVTWESLPDPVKRSLQPLTRQDPNAKYFRQVNGNRVAYGATYTDRGNEMWVRLNEAGEIVVQPVSAKTGRPIGANDREPEQASSKLTPQMLTDKVQFASLPKAVQTKVLKVTEGAKDVINMKHERGGKQVYHTVWTDQKGERHEAWYNEAGESIPTPKADR